MFKRKTVIVLSICVLVPVVLLVLRFGIGGWSASSLTVSRQTTFIEGALGPGGYPDYIAVLNEELSDGVTAENNAAVQLLRAMGPREIPPAIQAEFYKKLGAAPTASDPRFIDWSEYCKTIPEDNLPQWMGETPADRLQSLLDIADKTRERPWDGEEFPHLAKWVHANTVALDMVVAASKLPRYYAPLVSETDPPTLYSVLLPLTQQARIAAQALAVRAMLRLKEKQYQAAWDDLMACRRLGRLVGNGAFLVDVLVGYAVEGIGMEGQKQFLAEADLTADQWAALEKEIDTLPPRQLLAHSFDHGERFGVLDLILAVAQHGPQALAGMGLKNFDNPIAQVVFHGVDWNIPLEMANEWMDRFVAAAKIGDPAQRAVELAKIEGDVAALAAGLKDPHGIVAAIVSRKIASEKVGDMLIAVVCPAISAVFQAEARQRTKDDLVRVGIALARFKRDQGELPETLDKLMPAYLEAVPVDAFSASPLVYQRRDDGYLLYSIGANQVDEGGKGQDQNGDDIAVQIPANGKLSMAEPSDEAAPTADSGDAPQRE